MHADCSSSHGPRAADVPSASTKRFLQHSLATLSICLLAACGGGGGGDGQTAAPNLGSSGPAVTLSGQATFDYVPSKGGKLLYADTEERPIRGAAVEVIDQAGTPLKSTRTDAQGRYSVSLPADRSVRLRILAEIDANGVPVNVTDNTRADALYALESAAFSSSLGQVDLHANSGWTGTSYGQPRAAAPFAILDTVYRAQKKVMFVEPGARFKPLTLHWSEKNKPNPGDPAAGNITTSFFRAGATNGDIYVLGDAQSDTDEYDESVIAHEWGHYYQWVFSRNDSLGGAHGGEPLEMTTAFSEGWGHGFSGLVNERRELTDTIKSGQISGSVIFLDQPGVHPAGWYSEESIAQIIYLLGQKVGFAPIHTAMKAIANSPAFTSIFAFSQAVRSANGAAGNVMDDLLADQIIVKSNASDAYGLNEANDGGYGGQAARSVLPIYRLMRPGQSEKFCSFSDIGPYNKLGNHHFIRFEVPVPGFYRLTFQGGKHADGSDVYPEVSILDNGSRLWASPNMPTFDSPPLPLPRGITVLSVTDREVITGKADEGCVTVTINSVPK